MLQKELSRLDQRWGTRLLPKPSSTLYFPEPKPCAITVLSRLIVDLLLIIVRHYFEFFRSDFSRENILQFYTRSSSKSRFGVFANILQDIQIGRMVKNETIDQKLGQISKFTEILRGWIFTRFTLACLRPPSSSPSTATSGSSPTSSCRPAPPRPEVHVAAQGVRQGRRA